jgi:hypothetical protein
MFVIGLSIDAHAGAWQSCFKIENSRPQASYDDIDVVFAVRLHDAPRKRHSGQPFGRRLD